MPAEERTLINEFFRFRIQGVDANSVPHDVLVRPDRSLSLWSKLVGRNSKGERIAELDPYDLLRVRPYEPIFPVGSILMPAVAAVGFTSTAATSRVRVDVVNTSNIPGATCSVLRDVDGASGNFGLTGPQTPVLEGIGFRVGFFDLEPGGTISGSSSPANSCTLTVTAERYSPTVDTP